MEFDFAICIHMLEFNLLRSKQLLIYVIISSLQGSLLQAKAEPRAQSEMPGTLFSENMQ